MNASLRLFVIGGHVLRAGGVGGCLLVAASLASCASTPLAPAPVDRTSAASAEITAMARTSHPYPTFAQIPPAPTDVRGDRAWGRAAAEVEGQGAELARATAAGTWSLSGTEAFAQRAQADAGPTVGAESTTAATEAFAKQARDRATPPPSPKK